MADDLRASIQEAINSDPSLKDMSNDPIEVKAEPVQSVPDSGTDIQPDSPSDNPASDNPIEVDTDKTTEVDTDPAKPTDEPAADAIPPAPASWKGEAKQTWAELPKAARDEVVRRETHVNRVLAENADARGFVGAFQEVIQPYADRIEGWGLPPAQVFKTLLEADKKLSTAPPVQRAQYMAQLIKDYDINIADLDNALSGAIPAIPDVSGQVQSQIDAALAPFRQREQEQMQTRQNEVLQTIETMTDNSEFPLFEELREDMADYIELKAKRGVYVSIQDAYDALAGLYGAPKGNTAAIVTNNDAAVKAKKAAVSVSGSPSAPKGGQDNKDLRGTISALIDGI
jgi:hypothetical protein